MRLLLVLLMANPFCAWAETKTCKVSGMHCSGCVEMVEGKVCDQAKYSTCTVKIVDEKNEMGEIHLVTKEAQAKVDEKALKGLVKDSGYKMKSCTTEKDKKAKAS